MDLVVGSTGQLGTSLVRQLAASGRPVRGLARRGSPVGTLTELGAEIVWADLRDAPGLRAAVDGVEVVFATANVIAPRRGDSYPGERTGYQNLIAAARDAGVRRLVFPSVPLASRESHVPQFANKRQTEKDIAAGGVPYTILRCAPFMEVWLALPGSSIPIRGEDNPTLERPYGFLQQYRRRTGQSVEHDGRMSVPGSATLRNAFISLHDVARIMVCASRSDSARNRIFNVGGPQVLTWSEVAAAYSRVLGRQVRVTTVPAGVFRAAQLLMRPFAPAASNIMGLNWLSADVETAWTDVDPALADCMPADLRRVEDFLRAKAALAA